MLLCINYGLSYHRFDNGTLRKKQTDTGSRGTRGQQ